LPDQGAEPRIIYLAAPLFSQLERQWNRDLAGRLERQLGCSVMLPQEFGAGEREGPGWHNGELFRQCVEGVERCDAMVAVLDGADADSGTAFEMGYAYALGKPMVGLRTDFREQHELGTNLMLSRSCGAFVHLPQLVEDIDAVAEAVAAELRPLLGGP
jgi:nucleoside 2-deoxyribosyltransferase